MTIENFITICTAWLAFDAFADMLCIALCLMAVGIVRKLVSERG